MCRQICSLVALLLGSDTSIMLSRSLASLEMKSGAVYDPRKIFFESSCLFPLPAWKGRYPEIMAKSTIPRDQMSAGGPQ